MTNTPQLPEADERLRIEIIKILANEGGFDGSNYHTDNILEVVTKLAAWADRRCALKEVLAKIELLRNLDDSDVHFNHNTRMLLSDFYQDLNRQKQLLTEHGKQEGEQG